MFKMFSLSNVLLCLGHLYLATRLCQGCQKYYHRDIPATISWGWPNIMTVLQKRALKMHQYISPRYHKLLSGTARTQIPTTKNYALEPPQFGAVAKVNSPRVQLENLALEATPR